MTKVILGRQVQPGLLAQRAQLARKDQRRHCNTEQQEHKDCRAFRVAATPEQQARKVCKEIRVTKAMWAQLEQLVQLALLARSPMMVSLPRHRWRPRHPAQTCNWLWPMKLAGGLSLRNDCSLGQVLKWDGSVWNCAADNGSTNFWSLTGNTGTNPSTDFPAPLTPNRSYSRLVALNAHAFQLLVMSASGRQILSSRSTSPARPALAVFRQVNADSYLVRNPSTGEVSQSKPSPLAQSSKQVPLLTRGAVVQLDNIKAQLSTSTIPITRTRNRQWYNDYFWFLTNNYRTAWITRYNSVWQHPRLRKLHDNVDPLAIRCGF